MLMAHGKSLGVYRRTRLAWLLSGLFVFMGLVGGTAFFDPHPGVGGKVFGVAIAALCCGYAYVIWRTATVVLYPSGALMGNAIRPRWVPWDQMVDVSLQPDGNGYGQRGRVPVIRLKSGKSIKLGFFFVSDGRSSDQDLGQRVAQALRAHIRLAS